MCRINGIIDKSKKNIEQDTIRMRDTMQRGGPDSAGIFIDADKGLSMGHRRLSIIDLCDTGNQPMFSDDNDIVLVFNGEIFNYLKLKEELTSFGFAFSTQSDTEVIIKGYQKWGLDCFARFRGMFALALYDRTRNELILARDHAGIKPLYFFANQSSLYFASETKAFKELKHDWPEDPEWKIYFLTYGYLPGNITTLKGVKSLDKGSYIVFNVSTLAYKKGSFCQQIYSEEITDQHEAMEMVRSSMDTAVQRHLIADAPLGLFLSGGIDSSLLTLLASNYKEDLHTLSITFNEKNYTEKQYQQLIAQKINSNHQSFTLTKEIFIDALPDIMKAMDQPSSDGINSYFISKYARQAGLKAVLSGLGADELFGGYPSFKRTGLLNGLRKVPGSLLGFSNYLRHDKYKKLNYLKQKSPIGDYLFNRGYFVPSESARLLNMDEKQVNDVIYNIPIASYLDGISDGNKTSYLESNLYMENQLLKDTDYMSMWHSIEVRVPFLDYDLMKNIQRISSTLKYGHQQGKYLLIEAFADVLPEAIWNRKKQGFTFPFDEWMKDNLEQFMQGKQNQKLNQKFQSGRLSWSRYWTYLVSQSFSV